MLSQIDEALEDFKSGKMLVVVDNEDRENKGNIIFNAKFADEQKMNFCVQNAGGLICVAISQEIADSKHKVSTANLLKKLSDLSHVVAKKHGTIECSGHAEAAVDLSKLCGLPKAAIICQIAGLNEFCKKHDLKMISVEQIKNYSMLNSVFLEKSETAKLPTEFGEFNMVSYRNPVTLIEHAVVFKKNSKNKPIVRIHSECATGDIFFSLRCDCNQQLHIALRQIEQNGHGFLIYMKGHEGRGIGLFNKVNAYRLQESGLNTIQANERLGLLSDSRNYDDAVMIMNDLKLNDFILLTGNNQKSDFFTKFGFSFQTQPMSVKVNMNNIKYLQDKIKLMHHKTILEMPLSSVK